MTKTTNEKILAAVAQALRFELGAVGDAPGNCLRDVRLILEAALGWGARELYRRHLTDVVETPSAESPLRWTRNPHARDMERSFKAQGMEVDRAAMLPGDLLFNYRAAPYNAEAWQEDFPDEPFPDEVVYIGHVGIYLGYGMMLENIKPSYRPFGFTRQNLSITPLALYENYQGPVTTVIRFEPKEEP